MELYIRTPEIPSPAQNKAQQSTDQVPTIGVNFEFVHVLFYVKVVDDCDDYILSFHEEEDDKKRDIAQ